jgi:hypothetical protein
MSPRKDDVLPEAGKLPTGRGFLKHRGRTEGARLEAVG